MDNASDALKMAGAVLIFVMALSIIILAFTRTRQASDTILNYRDRETMYINSDYYYASGQKERNVNIETVIPTVYRAYLENYKVVFVGLNEPLYKIKNRDGKIIDKYTIDLERNVLKTYPNANLANNQEKSEFVRGILYHDFKGVESQDYLYNDTINNNEKGRLAFQQKFFVEDMTTCEALVDQLKSLVANGKKITEYIGVYYQNDNENEPEINKTEKRIITYKIN